MRIYLRVTIAVGLALIVVGCSSGDSSTERASAERRAAAPVADISATSTDVAGNVRGTTVNMAKATFDDQLAIFEGDGWGFSPSLLVFLFLDEGESPEGQTFTVSDESNFGNPHVHYRWRDPQSGDIETEAVSSEYEMTLQFGAMKNGELPGRIEFVVPGENTHVQGEFVATVE
jgi:hypothetical protein